MKPELFERAIDLSRLPRACPDRPRVAGAVKTTPEDFVVEEVPAYELTGQGAHLYLWVEKRDCSGGELLRRLASALGVDPGELGAAGTKDRRAVTRQWVSVPGDCEPRVATLSLDRIRVLDARRHPKKLKVGHLKGNRFRILLRGADAAAVPDLDATGRAIEASGFFNLYGPQRFGNRGETLATGLALLANGGFPPTGSRRMGGFERRMTVSSVQSALFNLWVAERVDRGLAATVLPGDVMTKAATGGLFWVEDAAVEQARFEAGETRLTGPMFGHKMMGARGEAGGIEAAVLDAAAIQASAFKVFSGLAEGTRRPMRAYPSAFAAAAAPGGVELSFVLPKGCYASVLLREFVLETDAAAADGEG